MKVRDLPLVAVFGAQAGLERGRWMLTLQMGDRLAGARATPGEEVERLVADQPAAHDSRLHVDGQAAPGGCMHMALVVRMQAGVDIDRCTGCQKRPFGGWPTQTPCGLEHTIAACSHLLLTRTHLTLVGFVIADRHRRPRGGAKTACMCSVPSLTKQHATM